MKHTQCPAKLTLAITLGLALSLGGCAKWSPFSPSSAEAVLKPTRGNTASGQMSFRPKGRDMLIQGAFSGLAPGAHGLHINEGGACGADAKAAGGHFNPTGARHGSPGAASHHLGDLPMLTAGADGTARFQALMPGLTLGDDQRSILHHAVTVTARPDDFTTQPTGNSGPAVACGVIGSAR